MLSTHLLSCSTESYIEATQHPFLKAARDLTLTHEHLSFWLSQDRIYAAHAYPRFIGTLISKIPFSSTHNVDSEEESKNKRLLVVLTGALQNVVREVDFFLEVSRKYNLTLDCWPERPETKSYCAEMARVASLCSLEEGLVFLWAMEQAYLDSWTYVANGLSNGGADDKNTTTLAIRDFARNWSSKDFVDFVRELQGIIDGFHVARESDLWRRIESIWKRVIELEVDFWPRLAEESLMRK